MTAKKQGALMTSNDDRPNTTTTPAIGTVEEAYRAMNEATILRESAEQYRSPHYHTSPAAKLDQANKLEGAAMDFLYSDDDAEVGSRELIPQSGSALTSIRRSEGESRELVQQSGSPPTSIRPRGTAAAPASNERLSLASEARSELATDMAESLEAANSAELGLTHQTAGAHALLLRLMGRADLEMGGWGATHGRRGER